MSERASSNHVATLLKDPFTRLYGAECSCGWRYTGLFPMDEWDKHADAIPNRVPTPAEVLCGAADLNGKFCIRSRGHSGSHWSKHGEPWYFDTPPDATPNRVRAERVAESVYSRSPVRDKDSDRLLEWHEIGPLLRETLIEQAQVYIEVTRYV